MKFLLPAVGLEVRWAVWARGAAGSGTAVRKLRTDLSRLPGSVGECGISDSRKAPGRKLLFKQASELVRTWSIKTSAVFQCIKLNG